MTRKMSVCRPSGAINYECMANVFFFNNYHKDALEQTSQIITTGLKQKSSKLHFESSMYLIWKVKMSTFY